MTTRTKTPPKRRASSSPIAVPGLAPRDAQRVIDILQARLVALTDLHLTLKHIHWNVVGVNFISVHEMLDPQVDSVRLMADATAERIATLGGEPVGTPGAITKQRSWNDYSIGRAPTVKHLAALDEVYAGVIADHRAAETTMADLDPVTDDMLVGQLGSLEQYQWFVRAHLQDASGDVVFRNTN